MELCLHHNYAWLDMVLVDPHVALLHHRLDHYWYMRNYL